MAVYMGLMKNRNGTYIVGASEHPNNLRARAKGQAERNAYAERQAYDTLRESLRGGNIAARLYADRLTEFLDAVDRFFGDADMADRALFSRYARQRRYGHACLRPLSIVGAPLPNCDGFYHVGCVRPRRAG
jgi:hypothetical protein